MTANLNSTHFLIDQQLEPPKNYLTSPPQNTPSPLQDLTQLLSTQYPQIQLAKTHGSYQLILQQSLATQDKPFLYQILIQNDPQIIRTSLQNLSPKTVLQLLKTIKSLLEQHIKLGKGEDHFLSIAEWLQQLLRLHLTSIVSNVENREIITGIRKFLHKKTQRKQQLSTIKSHLLSQQTAYELQTLNQEGKDKKNPKFQYIEQEKQTMENQQNDQNDHEKTQNEDMEDLDIEDLDIDDLIGDDF